MKSIVALLVLSLLSSTAFAAKTVDCSINVVNSIGHSDELENFKVENIALTSNKYDKGSLLGSIDKSKYAKISINTSIEGSEEEYLYITVSPKTGFNASPLRIEGKNYLNIHLEEANSKGLIMNIDCKTKN